MMNGRLHTEPPTEVDIAFGELQDLAEAGRLAAVRPAGRLHP